MSAAKTAIVESISKDHVIVSVDGKAQTLKGKAVEAAVGSLKLGDKVTFTGEGEPTTFVKGKGTSATAQPSQGRSPTAAPSSMKEAW